MSSTVEIVLAALGSGGLASVLTAWIHGRTANKRIDTELAKLRNESQDAVREAALRLVDDARSAAKDDREQTGRHVTGLLDCVRKCGVLEAENVELRSRVAFLEEEVRQLREQIALLIPDALRKYAESIADNVVAIGTGRKD
jgi:polyhydroxyalkanoate synthesis regulator phasin